MNKSLFRRPGTKHFQLVHRSQRDPLINDPDAPDRVFKEIDTSQGAKRAGPSNAPTVDFAADPEAEGDAASYGIFFDDKEYNYMQHLRQVGLNHDSYLVEAPTANAAKGKGKARRNDGFEMKDSPSLPDDVLPSHPLDEISYTEATTNAAPVVGLQPDLDPKVREVLEALDDDAYAADDGTGTDDEDDFWREVTHGGEVQEGEEDLFWENEEDEELDSDPEVEGVRQGVAGLGANGWDDVAKFKKAAKAMADAAASDEDEDYGSEGADTIAELRASSAKRPARGKKAGSTAGSQFSMTSSAMFRNEQLRTLDDRFDQIEKLYEESDEDDWDGEDYDEEELAEMKPPREDLEQIMDDFLSRFEVLGGKMKHVLEPTVGVEGQSAELGKLDRIRRELASLDIADEVAGEDAETTARRLEKEKILAIVERQERDASRRKRVDFPQMAFEKPKERWDCETVLSTYSNVSNHPRMLRVRETTRGPRPPKIAIDPKTGFPMVDGEVVGAPPKHQREDEDAEMEDEESEGELVRETVTRPRGESAEDKKARKASVKAERAARRTEKKSTKEAFGNEVKRQKRIAGKAVAGGAAADVRVGEGVRRLA